MKNGKCETKKEASDLALSVVAKFWLKTATAIIARGDKPLLFSDCGRTMVREELDRTTYDRVRRFLDSYSIFIMARREALDRLYRGEYPEVARYFSISPSQPMIKVPPASPVTPRDEVVQAISYLDRALRATDGGRKCPGPVWASLHDCRRSLVGVFESLGRTTN